MVRLVSLREYSLALCRCALWQGPVDMNVSSYILMQLALNCVEIRRMVSEIRCRPIFTFCFRSVLRAITCNGWYLNTLKCVSDEWVTPR